MTSDSMSWPPTVTPYMLPYQMSEEDGDNPNVGPRGCRHWKASLQPEEGEEGVTPYLHLQHFDKAEEVLDDTNNNVDTEVMFNSAKEAFIWRSRLRTFNGQSAADMTIPRSLAARKAAVKLVFKAYKSTALATDNAGMLKAFEEQKHDNRQVETVCWAIVEGCIDRCDRGPLLNAYEPDKAKNNAAIKTFADRLDAIVESLSHQKTICKHLLDAPYLNRFLDDPVGSKQRVESNRKLNKRKGGVMDVGKQALGLTGRKGRPRGDKNSNAGSEDDQDGYGSDQEYPGLSSEAASPYRTPDHQIIRPKEYGTPPPINNHSRRSVNRLRSKTPTPASRRRRAATSTTTRSPLGARNVFSSYPPPYGGGRVGPNSNESLGSQSPTMRMLPDSLMSMSMPSASMEYPPPMMGPSTGSMNYFDTPGYPYPTTLGNVYHDPFAGGPAPTSAPFQLSDPFREAEATDLPMVEKSSPSSEDTYGSDGEYQPGRSRKRGRRH